jgi:hypothetical protein
MGAKVAQAAAAVASIAKGAAAGGLAGAAVGAVKAFLPQLMRLAVILVVLLLVIPFLIIAALPNVLFGYDSAQSDDIIALTQKAYSIDAAYKEVKNYDKEAVDKIIEDAKAANTTDGTANYDDVDVTEVLDNTNIYWLIAITSVAHKQDLFSMSEDAIKNMTVSKISYTASIVETESGTGDATATMKTLKIDIKDLNPDELMDKLNFTEEERNWARVLFGSMTEHQYVGITDSDGEGYYGTDYGDITFTDAATEVVYYNQTDSRWGSYSYGKTGTIASSACGPASLAIVVASMTDNKITPKDVADWSVENGYRCEGNGSYHSLIPEGGAHYGLNVEGIGRDAKKLVQALEDGKLVIAIMTKGHFTKGGHFIVIRGVTSEGKLLVADPASYKRSEQEWAVSLVVNEASRKAGSGGPFWAFSN